MAAQTTATYSMAAGKSEEPIVKELESKYGSENISWPIVLGSEGETLAYLYERNERNLTNRVDDIRPISKSDIQSHFIDYTSTPHVQEPKAEYLAEIAEERYTCSYDFIPSSQYTTVDLDYVWNTGNGFRGFELTTFWVEFSTKEKALRLVSMMNRRPSWKGPGGAYALSRIVDAALDLQIDYYLVCANTIEKVGSRLATDGNVLFFPLTHEQIDRLSTGLGPQDRVFCSFSEFLQWL